MNKKWKKGEIEEEWRTKEERKNKKEEERRNEKGKKI